MTGTRQRKSAASPAAPAPAPAPEATPQPAAVPADDEPSSWFEQVVPVILLALSPSWCQLLAFITNSRQFGKHYNRTITGFITLYQEQYATKPMGGVDVFYNDMFSEAVEEVPDAARFLGLFTLLALILYWWGGTVAPIKYGPITPKGARPDYIDNGIAHCFLFTLVFLGLSDFSTVFGLSHYFSTAGWFHLSIMFTNFQGMVLLLNAFGLLFCLFLYFKGKHAPSGPDNGTSGKGVIFDYYWGMELYPRIFGVDVKRFVNCRFSMTFWMLAGIGYLAADLQQNGNEGNWESIKPGLFFTALSQFIYLVKFFKWEIGYMRSIDIIVDRAGFYETWGCLVWVPSVYTLHTRSIVNAAPQHTWYSAGLIFLVGTVGGVLLNFWADSQRQWFREADGNITIWGQKAKAVRCKYVVRNSATGKLEERESLLLASGFWGAARHFQYLFELMAAWSWCLLSTNFSDTGNGVLPLFYATFLTILLIHRADRDELKCIKKYGDGYRRYMDLVPYKIIPGIY